MMLEVVEFIEARVRKYGLRNNITGIVLPKRFWTPRGALRYRSKITGRLNKLVRSINNS